MDRPTWLTAFLDLPDDEYEPAVAFWQDVTGYRVSPTRGEHDEFATLVPPEGDGFLRVQRVQSGPSAMHLDVHVPGHPFEVRRSPGGFAYCLVPGEESARPVPATWNDGNRSMVDQICLDIPPDVYDEECAFWSGLTGWQVVEVGGEFRRLRVPADQPLAVLLQRLDTAGGPVRAHLDLSADDRAAEVRRHEALGAQVRIARGEWTVMQPPAGPVYCITDRRPRDRAS